MTKQDFILISKIAKRAIKIDNGFDYLTLQMDLHACIENNNSLKLEELLNADEFNFCHDIYGISNNMNRETGKLENCFLPRYAS